jgi:hypothetical protein
LALGSLCRNQIDLVAAGGGRDKTTLENLNAKLNAQIVSSNSAEVWYLRKRQAEVRAFGRPDASAASDLGPDPSSKHLEDRDSQIVGSSLFLSAQYDGADGTFTVLPEGGLATQTFLDADGVWHNSYAFIRAPHSHRQVKVDVSDFFNTGTVSHELKAGFGYLRVTAKSTSGWPGDGSGGLARRPTAISSTARCRAQPSRARRFVR